MSVLSHVPDHARRHFPPPSVTEKNQPTNNFGYGSVVYMTSLNSNRHFKVNKKENDFLIWKQNSPKWWWRPTSMMLDMAPWRRLYKCFIWHKRVEFVFLFLKNKKDALEVSSMQSLYFCWLDGRTRWLLCTHIETRLGLEGSVSLLFHPLTRYITHLLHCK